MGSAAGCATARGRRMRAPPDSTWRDVDLLATGRRRPLQPRRRRLAARPRPADGGAAGAPPSRRRRAGGGRAGARHRPPAARVAATRRTPSDAARAVRRGAGGAGGRDRGAARGGEAVSRGDRARVRRRAHGPTAWSRCGRQGGAMTDGGGGAFLALPLGDRRRDAAPGRRQREGRGAGGRGPGQLGAPPARTSRRAGAGADAPGRPLAAGPLRSPPAFAPPAGRSRVEPVDVPVTGHCDARFGAVREEFARNFAERGEVGAAVCVVVDGATVVDLAGGWADAGGAHALAARHAWSTSTRSGRRSWRCSRCSWSTPGWSRSTTRSPPSGRSSPPAARRQRRCGTRLCHRAGVPAIREPLTNDDLWDWDRMTAALAATEPWWEPGHAPRLPHQHLRASDRRGRAPGER